MNSIYVKYHDKMKANSRRYHQEHRVERKAYNQSYYDANKDYYQAANKAYIEKYPEINPYRNAKRRCNDSSRWNYHNYGGRGIKFLYKAFAEFFLDVGPRPNDNYQLDRIDNNGNYELGNCRWVTKEEQRANRRDSRRTSELSN